MVQVKRFFGLKRKADASKVVKLWRRETKHKYNGLAIAQTVHMVTIELNIKELVVIANEFRRK